MRQQFKETITALAREDESIILLFGDVSVYLFNDFKQLFPDRFFNLGICENSIISVSGGLSSQGYTPFVHTIAPFLTERSYEQIKLDLCYNQFAANIITCGATFDYAWDGATHHSYTDLAILRLLPGMEVVQPGCRKELDVLIRSQYNNDKVTYFRLSDHPHQLDIPAEFGKGVIWQDRKARLTIMTAGPLLGNVALAAQDLPVNLVYFHTIKPIDHELIAYFRDTQIVVIHDAFGLYEAVCEVPDIRSTYYGLKDQFYCLYGTLSEIRQHAGLDVQGIREFLQKRLRSVL